MAKKLTWRSNFSTDDLSLDWEDDIFHDFPFLSLKENGLKMTKIDDLTVITDNMVRGLTKSKGSVHKEDGLVSQKLGGLRGSLRHGWDRTSWPIPFMLVNGENQTFDRRHTYFVCAELPEVDTVPTAEYVRVKSKVGGIINKFSDASIQMMASMWGNVYGPTVDDTKDYQFERSIAKILRQEKHLLNLPNTEIYTKDNIKLIFKYMGGEDRYPVETNNKHTVTRIINNVYSDLNETQEELHKKGCINSNIQAYDQFVKESNDWLENNRVDESTNTVFRHYKITSNTYHMYDVIRKLMLSVCKEEQKNSPKTTKVLLYNQTESDRSEKIETSRFNFQKSLAEFYYPIRNATLAPFEDILAKSVIPKRSLDDLNLEVYAMHQIDGEEEPLRLNLPDPDKD